MTPLFIVVTTLFLLVILFVIISYNRMVKNRNRMNEAWSVIDVFIKKRHDLIPNLVKTVKGYAEHERSVLEEIVRVRSLCIQSQSVENRSDSETKLDQALVHLFGVVENYPELKANQNFLDLQQQISRIENDLEKSRRYYNGTVRINNILVESFPVNIIARLFNFDTGSFFKIDF